MMKMSLKITMIMFLLSLSLISTYSFAGEPSGKILSGRIIVIDPGHGGTDTGAVGKFVRESELNLKVALYLREMLEECGATVVMTRASDIDVDLKYRADLANRVDGDLFVSIHFNSMPNSPESDFSIAYYSSYSADYARNVASYLIETFRKYVGTNGDAGPGQVYVMRAVKIPAILGEPCVISNEKREKWLMIDENLKAVALSYKEAICKLFANPIPTLDIQEISTINNWNFLVRTSGNIAKAYAFFDNQQLDTIVMGETIFVSIPENVKPGKYSLIIYAIDQNGIYSRKYTKEINFVPPVDDVKVTVLPTKAPAVPGSYYVVEVYPYSKGHAISFNPISIEIDGGFIIKENDKLIVPFMGDGNVNVKIIFESTVTTIPLDFSGDKYVEVLKLYNKKGEFLGVLENTGVPLTIRFPEYEEITYISVPSKPVSFKNITLQRDFRAFLTGKKILLVSIGVNENLNMVASALKEYGCDVEIAIIQNKRDEINISKNSSNFDFVFLKDTSILVRPKIASCKLSTNDELYEIIDFLQKFVDTN